MSLSVHTLRCGGLAFGGGLRCDIEAGVFPVGDPGRAPPARGVRGRAVDCPPGVCGLATACAPGVRGLTGADAVPLGDVFRRTADG